MHAFERQHWCVHPARYPRGGACATSPFNVALLALAKLTSRGVCGGASKRATSVFVATDESDPTYLALLRGNLTASTHLPIVPAQVSRLTCTTSTSRYAHVKMMAIAACVAVLRPCDHAITHMPRTLCAHDCRTLSSR